MNFPKLASFSLQCWSCRGACGCGWRAGAAGQGDCRRRLPHPFPLLPGGRLLVGVLGGREYSTSSLPPPPHTQFLRGDDATLRRLRRQRLSRSFHHSLPSLLHSLPQSSLSPSPSSPPRRRLPADGAEGGGGREGELGNPVSSSSFSSSSSSSSTPSPSPYHQVFFDAERFHDDELEAKRIEEEDEVDEEEEEEEEPKRKNGKKRSSYRAVPASPHPLQKSRLVKRCPVKARIGRREEEEEGEEGIVELRYTLNFSTPVLHEADVPFSMSSRGDLPLCVPSRDLPFSISTHIQHGPRVSFQDELKSSKKNKKKKDKTSSRSAGNSRSKDIRLKMEWSTCLSDEKLSPPMVEYKVSDLGLLCPLKRMKMAKGEDEKAVSERAAKGEGLGNSCCSVATSAQNYRWKTQVAQPDTSKIKRANTTSSSSFSPMTIEPATVTSGVARSNAHVFSTVIVHRVGGNVHM